MSKTNWSVKSFLLKFHFHTIIFKLPLQGCLFFCNSSPQRAQRNKGKGGCELMFNVGTRSAVSLPLGATCLFYLSIKYATSSFFKKDACNASLQTRMADNSTSRSDASTLVSSKVAITLKRAFSPRQILGTPYLIQSRYESQVQWP